LGDTRREQAGKISTFKKEQGDIQDYYSQQRDAETKRITLAKEQEKTKTDMLVQQTLDDATLTDSQKIEAVLAQQDTLNTRLAELDTRQQELAMTSQQNAADLANKQATLASKAYSSTYDTAKNTSAAIKNGQAIIAQYTEKYNTTPTVEQATQVFIDSGLDPEKAKQYATMYGNTKDPNAVGSDVNSAAAAAGY
jgi:hypothetical protein